MTRATLTGLLGALLVALAVVPAWAADDPPKSYLVLVGIGDYADKQIKPRKHAETDAKALYDLFTAKDHLGVPAENVKLLLGSKDDKRKSEPATRENILKAVRWAVTNAGRDDLLVFAFFGQGAPLGERTCFLASDSTFKDRSKNAVAGADIEHELEKLKSQRFCAFVDVHFKGFDAGKEPVVEPNPMDLYRIFMGNHDREDQEAPPGRVVFLATNGLRPSLDLKAQGLFAKVVTDALKGGGDKEGYEADGLVTVDELIEYLNKELPELARTHGQTKEEKEQLHHALGGRSSHFPLTLNPTLTAKVKERLGKLDKLAADQKISKEVHEEGQRLLGRMPKLQAQQDLRKNFQKLVDGTLAVDQFLKNREQIYTSMKLRRPEADEFANKVMQAVRLVQESYVKELNTGDMCSWAIQGLLRRVEERKLLEEMKDRLSKVKNLKEKELLTLLADVRERLGKREDLEKNKDVDIAVQMMLARGGELGHIDAYTNYIDAEMLARVRTEMTGRFTGIGIQIRKDAVSDQLMVVTPIRNSPAYKAGVKTGDMIIKVTCYDKKGKALDKPEVIPTKGLALSDAVSRILGPAGTKVAITVERQTKDGKTETKEFEIIRGAVEVESVMGVKRKDDDSWDFQIDADNRIVYVRITSFSRNTYRDLKAMVDELHKKPGIKGLVLDLRFNPGGLLDSAVRISDLFIDDGVIVSIRPRVGREHSFTGQTADSHLSFPMVCLVNGGSASGSEIVAGCLQDHRRAVVMGERSYGKGSVQNIQPFELTGGEIKLTTATFWRPSGKNINKSSTKGKDDEEWGISPEKDYHLKLTPKERDELGEHHRNVEIIPRRDLPPKETKPEFKDRQLESALEYLRNQIKTAARTPAGKAG